MPQEKWYWKHLDWIVGLVGCSFTSFFVLLLFLAIIAHSPLAAFILSIITATAIAGIVAYFIWRQRQHQKLLAAYHQQRQIQAQQQAYQQWQHQQREQVRREQARQVVERNQQLAIQRRLEEERLAQERQQEEERLAQERQQEEERKRLRDAKLSNGLLHLSARDFELTIGSLLQAYGYKDVKHTGKAGDNGADLHATSPTGERVIIQCKRYAPGQTVSTAAIRDMIGAILIHHADRGIFVTPSKLSKNAQALASQHNIDVIDGDKLNTMLAQARGTTQTF